MMRVFMRVMAGVGLLACLSIFWFALNFDHYARVISDRILANAAIPTEREMPPTASQVAFSSADVQVVGGRGEGLSCSLPQFLEGVAFFPDKGRDAIGLEMRQACISHDYCYRHGAATYGYTQADCDFALQEQAFRLCYFIERSLDPESLETKQSKCIRDARLVTLGVRLGGSDAFRSLTSRVEALATGLEDEVGYDGKASTYFEFDPYPVRSSSYAVYRIADSPGSEGKITGRKSLYKFSIRPSGMFISVADLREGSPDGIKPKLHAIVPGDPAFLVNAPLVLGTNRAGRKEDWFVWWQRRGLSETGGRVLAIAPGRANKADWSCLYESGMASATRIGTDDCHARSTAIAIINVGSPSDQGDADFAQILPAHIGSSEDATLRMMALQTRACLRSEPSELCFRNLIVDVLETKCRLQAHPFDPCIQPSAKLPVIDRIYQYIPGVRKFETDRYRNFATAPYVLHPSSDRSVLMWVRRDRDYRSQALVRRLAVKESKNSSLMMESGSFGSVQLLDIQEADEPLFLTGRSLNVSSLVSFRKQQDDDRQLVAVRRWTLPPGRKGDFDRLPEVEPQDMSCDNDVEATWLDRPPIVTATADGTATVIFSRAAGEDQHAPDRSWGLQLAMMEIKPSETCASKLAPGPSISFLNLIPEVTGNDAARDKNYLKQRRTEMMRQTPILTADLEGDGRLQIIFPGAGHKNFAKPIATIAEGKFQ